MTVLSIRLKIISALVTNVMVVIVTPKQAPLCNTECCSSVTSQATNN